MRKNQFKKHVAMGLTMILAMSTFAGCGKSDSRSKETAANTTSEKSADKEKADTNKNEDPVTIDWLAYNCYGQPDPNAEVVKEIEQKFNVKLNFWYVDDQKWDEVLGAKLASGDMPDVMRIKNTSNIATYVKQGILAEVTDDMLAKVPTYMKYIKQFDTTGSAFTDLYYDGKLYGFKTPSDTGVYPTVLTWRLDWLKKVGMNKMPSTIDEFEKAIYAFRNDDPDGNGKKDTYGMSNTVMNAVFGAYGAIPLKEFRGTGTQNLFYTMKNDKVAFACVQPEMKEALKKLQKWYKDGVIDPEFVTGENTAGYWATSQAFENDKVGVTGMAMSAHWAPPLTEGTSGGACYTGFTALHPDTKWGETIDIGSAITGPSGESGTHTWGAFNTTGVGITTKCAKDPRKVNAIFKILETYSSDDDYATLASFGIKDVNYKINADGTKTQIEPYNELSDSSRAGIGVVTIGYNPITTRGNAPKSYEFYDKYKTTGYEDILVPQTEAASQYLTDLKTYALDSYIKIITGEEKIDYFDTFVSKFNDMGGKQIVDEINEAVAKNN